VTHSFLLYIYFYFYLSTCFEHIVVVIRRDKSFQYNLWLLSLCVGGRIVCRSVRLRLHFFVLFVDNYLNMQNKFSACLNSYDLGEFRVLTHFPHSFNWALVFYPYSLISNALGMQPFNKPAGILCVFMCINRYFCLLFIICTSKYIYIY
jgi:hypothetical protein